METIGSEKITKAKLIYLGFMFLVLGFLWFASIGATMDQKNMLYWYIGFGFTMGIVPTLFDFVMKKEKPFDTIMVESYD